MPPVRARGGAGGSRLSGTAPRRTTPRTGTRVRACVVIANLRGFDTLAAQLEPKRVAPLLHEFLAAISDVAVAHHALIDTVVGDGVLLLYGVPAPRRDDPVRAVRAAAALQRAALALRNRWLAAGDTRAAGLRLAVGVAAGEVLVVDLSARGGRAATPLGEPLRRAERLCAAARGGETLVDEATYASAAPRLDGEWSFSARPLGGRAREPRGGAYRAQPRRAALRVVATRAVGTGPLAG